MPALIPAQLKIIRHNLNAACRLLEPAPENKKAFQEGLLSLLLRTGEWPNEHEAGSYLAGILRHTCLATDYETPRQNSSPVCYANTPGLREGFEEVAMPGPSEACSPEEEIDFLAKDGALEELFSATQSSVRQILSDRKGNRVADTLLEKQISDLVCQLFGQPAGSH